MKNGDKKYANIIFKEKIKYRLRFEKNDFLQKRQFPKEEKIEEAVQDLQGKCDFYYDIRDFPLADDQYFGAWRQLWSTFP